MAIAQTETSPDAGTNTPATVTSGAAAATPDVFASKTTLLDKVLTLQYGPFNVHPRLSATFTYDDNITFATANPEADEIWNIRPAFQAVAGDDAALIEYRDQHYDVLNLSPGGLIIEDTEARPGKLFILDYGPGFQIFDKYSANNSIDEFGTLNLLWPMNKLILGLKQMYQLQKAGIVEAGERATTETISTTLSAAYQFGDKTSLECDFVRNSLGYNLPGLIGFTEYNNANWLNYELGLNLHASLGLLEGQDYVTTHQDQTFEQLNARARYNYTTKLAFDVSSGVELREYQNGNSDTLFPVFTVAASYQPTQRTTFQLTGYRRQNASIYNGYNFTSTGATLGVNQGITDRFGVGLSAGYYVLGYLPTTSALAQFSDDYYIARIALDAKIVRHLTGEIFYQLLSRQSPVNGDLSDDQSGVQLTLSF